MFGFIRRKADVLEHWFAIADGFQLAPSKFYDAVERELKARELPGMDMTRVDFAEGGLLSDKRVYLRMLRERLVFDICAAPFGTGFFSCRFAEIPAVVQLWQILALVGVVGFAGLISLVIFTRIFGALASLFLWPLAWIAFLLLAVYLMRNSVALGLQDLDKTLLRIPVINAVYEAWIRKETYYRVDTRLMYLEVVSGVVKRLALEATAATGVTLVRQYEQAPILGELYKRVPPSPETPPPK